MIKPKVKFITGPELIHEINICKASYSHYLDEKYVQPTVTVKTMKDITPALFKEGRRRIARGTPRQADDVQDSEVIIRVMDNSHVDMEMCKGRRGDGTGLIFPAFKHFVKTEEGLKEVMRSHWVGGFDNGCFSMTHGRLTNKMGKTIILLANKYGKKGNWAGYSYVDEMKANAEMHLTQNIMKFNDAITDNAFAYVTQIMQNCFLKELKAQKKQQSIKDEVLMNMGHNGSYGSQGLDKVLEPSECKVYSKEEIAEYLRTR